MWGLMAVAVTAAACSKPSWRPYTWPLRGQVWRLRFGQHMRAPSVVARLRAYDTTHLVVVYSGYSYSPYDVCFPFIFRAIQPCMPLPYLCPTLSPPPLLPPPPIIDRRLTHRVCRSALLLGVGPTGSAPSGTHTRPAGRLLSCPFWQGGQTRGRGAASIPRSLWVCRAVSTGPLTQCLFVPPPAIGAPLI